MAFMIYHVIVNYCYRTLEVDMKYIESLFDALRFIIDEVANFNIKTIFRITDNLISIQSFKAVPKM